MLAEARIVDSVRRSGAALLALALVSSLFVSIVSLVEAADSADADSFGYKWIDSRSPSPSVTYNWVEITGTGTDAGIFGDDTYTGPINLGFVFPFYTNTYSQVYLSTNGFVSFAVGSWEYANQPIPQLGPPNNFIAPYWDDLYIESSGPNAGHIYYQSIGASPNAQFVVEWSHVKPLGYSVYMTFEVILNETGEIWFQYQSLSTMTGSSATVGIENSDGTVGVPYSYNTAALTDGLAVMFDVSDMAFGDTQSRSGTAGSEVSYPLTVRNNQPLDDSFDLSWTSEHGWPLTFYDSTGTVPLTDTNGDALGLPDTGPVPSGTSVSVVAKVSIPASPTHRTDNATLTARSFSVPGLSDITLISTTVYSASLSPPYAESISDDDLDGLADSLVLSVDVTVLFPCELYLYADLVDSSLLPIFTTSASTWAEPGMTTFTLTFLGMFIHNHGADGPYTIMLNLYDATVDWSLIDSDTHTTNPYLWSDFEGLPSFDPPHSDYGLDTDSDGLLNYLVLELRVNITTSGSYWVWADVFTDLGDYVTSETSDYYLTSGVQTVELLVPGSVLRAASFTGTYEIALDLGMDLEVIDYSSHLTATYDFRVFDFDYAIFETPHASEALDTNGNGLYEYLVLTARVNTTSPGTYMVQFTLFDSLLGEVRTMTNVTDLVNGLNEVEVMIPGWVLRDHGVTGVYHTNMRLFTDSGLFLDEDLNTTASYAYDQFEMNTHFESTGSAYGIDTDSNSKYDYLVVEVSLNVTFAGTYPIGAYAYTSSWSYIGYGINYTYLDTGLTNFQIWIDGRAVYQSGYNGTINIIVRLWNEEYDTIDSISFTTGLMNYTDFDPPDAMFVPPHSDYGLDTDADGYYNYLVIVMAVNITSAGEFFFVGDLRLSSDDTYVTSAYNTTTLPTGLQTVELWFASGEIYSSGYVGSFRVYLYAQNLDWFVFDTDVYLTGSYEYAQFDRSSEFVPPHTDYGLDTGVDGAYNYLVIEAEMFIDVEGSYNVVADLFEGTYSYWITQVVNTTFFTSGMHTLVMMLDGRDIYDSGYDGPYNVHLRLYTIDWTLLDDDDYTTSSYLWTDFQGPIAYFSPPHSDSGLDTDADGFFDYLSVNVSVQIDEAGDYTILAELFYVWWDDIDVVENETYLDVGLNVVQLLFSGPMIRESGETGNFYVDLYLYDESMMLWSTDTHVTASYSYDDFVSDQAMLIPPHADEGRDTDGDLLYDYIVIEVSVRVFTPSDYRVVANVYDGAGIEWIVSTSNASYFGYGDSTIQLFIPGVYLYNSGFDGPYMVEIQLRDDDTWEWLDSNVHYTAAYLFTDFDPPNAQFSPPHSDFAYDSDSDGLDEWLVVEVVIDVIVAGDYRLYSWLYTSGWTYIGSDSNFTYLDTGLQVVQLVYDSSNIFVSGYDGTFIVEMELWDSMGTLQLDTDTHTTSAYSYWQFEPPPCSLAPPYDDYGLDADSDTLYDYLVAASDLAVYQAGMFYIEALLYDDSWNTMQIKSKWSYFDVGTHTLEFLFDGSLIYDSGLSYDEMYVYMYACDGVTFAYIDDTGWWTDTYSYDEFEEGIGAFSPPWLDDFEAGTLGGSTGMNWSSSIEGMAGVDDTAVGGGTYSMWLCGGLVRVASNKIDLSGLSEGVVRFWVQRGSDAVSDAPEAGDDLEIYYMNDWGSWNWLGSISGDGTPGEVMTVTLDLPWWDALHSEFRVMFRMSNGDGPGTDFWYIDNVYVGSPVNNPPTASFTVTPASGSMATVFTVDASGSWDFETPSEDLEVRWDWEDDGVWDTSWSTDKVATHQYSARGTFVIRLEVLDLEGLTSQDTATVEVANAAPTAVFTVNPVAGNSSTVFMFDASGVSDYEDITDLLAVRWDWEDDGTWDLGWTTYKTAAHAYSGTGRYTVVMEVMDTEGATNSTSVVVYVDDTAPTTIAELSGTLSFGWYVTPAVLVLNATDNVDGSGIAATYYRINGGSWQSYSSQLIFSSSGVYIVQFYSVDNAGNTENADGEITFRVDVTDPVTTIDIAGTEGENGWYHSDVVITLDGEDSHSGLDVVRYRLVGQTSWLVYSSPIQLSGEGIWTLEYYAEDEAGNIEATHSLVVGIDTIPPVIEIDQVDGTVFTGDVLITWNATDSGSGIVMIEVSLDGGAFIQLGATNTSVLWTLLEPGEHTVVVRAVDEAGHNATDSIQFVVKSEGGGISGSTWALIGAAAAIAALVVILVVFFLMRKRRALAVPMPPPPPEVPPPPSS